MVCGPYEQSNHTQTAYEISYNEISYCMRLQFNNTGDKLLIRFCHQEPNHLPHIDSALYWLTARL